MTNPNDSDSLRRDSIASQIRRDNVFGFIDGGASSERLYHPQLIANVGADTMLKSIRDELRRCSTFVFSVAFVTPAAIALLKQSLIDFPGRGTIITSTYLGFNSPGTFRELLNLEKVDVLVHSGKDGGFHAKGYVFQQTNSTTAIIGSSNLTEFALLRNHEWNLRFSALPDGDIVEQLRRAVGLQRDAAVRLTPGWIDDYELDYIQPRLAAAERALEEPLGDIDVRDAIRPNEMQSEALAEIQKVRDAGESRAVVVSATGTGKTILAALDVRAVDPHRMLFLVHREQILDRAIYEFSRVLDAPPSEFGKYAGALKQVDRRFVFATVQSFSRAEAFSTFDSDAFDYIIIDEMHRTGGSTYRRVIDYFRPRFLLGLTATPERTDGFDVFELFDYNVPYEIRLKKALESDMLAPFHYYGVTEFENSDGQVIDEAAQLSRLIAPERADHIVAAMQRYGHVGQPVRGLLFCSRRDEATELSALLNARAVRGRTLRTRVLTGEHSIETRDRVVEQLERGELDYILTVDIFNEGIDIPTVNQVVMLRQTQSSIVFTQQLGRGLRKAAGKDYLVVIDFIGNYANNYLIPIALFGDSSLNKDSIRKRLIEAEDAGAISGLSSVSFDSISRERVFTALASAKLDSMSNLKRAYLELESRLGTTPALLDFARFDLVDPTVIATKHGNYWEFLSRLRRADTAPLPAKSAILTFLSSELLNGKRPHELLLLQQLLEGTYLDRRGFESLLLQRGCVADRLIIESVERILSLEFFTESEVLKYGGEPIVLQRDGEYLLSESMRSALQDKEFIAHVRDIVDTGLFVARHSGRWSGGLQIGQRYSRKDACRLLNWQSNQYSTIYGYKVDIHSNSCPIFVTYHKDGDVAASTNYEDAFLNPSTLRWYSKNNRTLRSGDVVNIAGNRVPLHLFAKKDDAEGTDFFYLGTAQSRDARQEQMPNGKGGELNVVSMSLDFDTPVELGLYDYLRTAHSG